MTYAPLVAIRPGIASAWVSVTFALASAAATLLAIYSPLAALVAAYVVFFWVIAWRRPDIGLVFVFASAPFQWDLSVGGPVRFSFAEVNLFLLIPVLLAQSYLQRRRLSIAPLSLPVIFLFVISCGAAALHWRPATALVSLVQMFLYLVVAVWVFSSATQNLERLRFSFHGLIVVCLFLGIAALTERTGASVLGIQKNGIGGSLGCGVIVCAELWLGAARGTRKWVLGAALLIITAAMICTLSRGAWLGAFLGLTVLLLLRGRIATLFRLLLVLVPLVALCWAYLPSESKQYAISFDKDRENIRLRYESIEFAEQQFLSHPWTGVGVGLRKEYDATNIVLLTLAETGIPGLVAFAALNAAAILAIWKTQRTIPRANSLYPFLAISMALVISKLGHGMVDHYWSRGEIMIAWSAVGMAIGVMNQLRAATAPCPRTIGSRATRPGESFRDRPPRLPVGGVPTS